MDHFRQHTKNALVRLTWQDFAIIASLSLMTVSIHWNALKLWWICDDPYILRVALSNSLFASFSDPTVYQQLSLVSFTPLLVASFKLDYLLFGSQTLGYYVHQLLLLVGTASLVYLFIRRWSRIAAAWGSALFIAGGPAAAATHLLMTRHYLEGSVFALITISLLYHHRSSRLAVWMAGITYLLACLSKEVYVPLVVVAPLFISGPVRERLRTCGPLFLSSIIYILWRIHMLSGAGLGGYMPNWFSQWANPRFILKGLGEIAAGLWSAPTSGVTSGIFLAAATIVFLLVLRVLITEKQYDKAFGVLMLTGVALIIIAPVWGECQSDRLITHRLFFHISLIACTGGAFLASRALGWFRNSEKFSHGAVSKLIVLICLFLPVLFAAVLQNRIVTATMTNDWIPQSRENQFYFTQPVHRTLISTPGNLTWEDLKWVREYSGGGQPPTVCMQAYDLRNESGQFFCYDMEEDRLVDCTHKFVMARKDWLEHVIYDDGFEVHIEINKGKYTIQLAATEPGEAYYLLFGVDENIYSGALRIPPSIFGQISTKPTAYHVRVAKVRSNQQWSLSPEWVLNLADQQTIRWP